MYQITRKNKIKEALQFCHADGSVALTLEVDLNVDQIAGRVNKAQQALGAAQIELQKNPTSAACADAYGNAVIALFEIIFGKDGTEQLVAFYENCTGEMLLDVFPFINGEILPKIRQASADRKAQILEAARAVENGNRAARRKK